MKYWFFTLFLGLFCFIISPVPKTVYAQFNQTSTTIDLGLVPQNPGPNEVVSATLTSYGTNLDLAQISWLVNGKAQKNGRGMKTFTFSTGNLNTVTSLEAVIRTHEGETIDKTIKTKPTSIDLIWQTDGFVPPFYKGKALFSYQNKITLIAVPHVITNGIESGTGNFVYKWTRDGSVIDNASGYGKNTYTFTQPVIARQINIKVEVSSANSGIIGNTETVITPGDPKVVLYEKNPLYGIEFQKALTGDVNLLEPEISIIAEPFYFGTLSMNDSNLSYKWQINGKAIDDDTSFTTRVFRPQEGTSGVSSISVMIDHAQKILQSASVNFNLNYESGTKSAATF